jgi:hypothetical protein
VNRSPEEIAEIDKRVYDIVCLCNWLPVAGEREDVIQAHFDWTVLHVQDVLNDARDRNLIAKGPGLLISKDPRTVMPVWYPIPVYNPKPDTQ